MNAPHRLSRLLAGGDRRFAVALAVSFGLHILLALAVPAPAMHVDYLLAQAAPPALSVRLANPSPPAEAGGPPPPRIDLRKADIPTSKARIETPAVAGEERPGESPPKAPPAEPATYAGITVTDATYSGPLPPRAVNFEGSSEYLRKPEVDEPPVAQDIAVPEYPSDAVNREAGGTVLVALFIDEEGRVVHAAAVSASEPLFEFMDGVARALSHSVFTPARRAGVPVKSLIFQAVRMDPAVPAPGP